MIRNKLNNQLLIVIFMMLSGSIFSQDLLELDLEDLLNIEVTTASKSAEKVSDAPGIITVISEREIKKLGANSLADVLERAPSMQVISSHLFRENIASVRGDLLTHNDIHVLVLLNGRPMREGVTGGLNSPAYTSFPVDLIQHIEIVRGPGSVLYGSNAYAGVINIITKNAPDNSKLNVSVGAGSFGSFNGNLTASTKSDDFSVIVSAQLNTEEGWDYQAMTRRKPTQTPPDKTVDFKYGNTRLGLGTKLAYKSLTLSGFYSKIKDDVLGIFPYSSYVGENDIERLFIDLGYNVELSSDWLANFNVTYNSVSSSLGENDDPAVTPSVHNATDYLGEASLNGKITDNLNTVVGIVLDSRNKNSIPYQSAIKETYSQLHFTTYIQADYRPLDALKLIAGAQLNKPDEGDVDVVPRIGAIYNFTNGLGIKALYGQAFRSPWPLEQMVDNAVLKGNSNLTPEKIATMDLQVFYSSGSAEYSLTYFNSKYEDLINRVPLSPGVQTFANLGEMSVSGVEAEAKVNVNKELYLVGSFTYQDNEEEITFVPSTMVKTGAIYNTQFGLSIGLFNSFYGEPRKNSGAELNPVADAISLLSLNLNYKVPSLPLEVNLYAKNLLDNVYHFPEFSKKMINTLPIAPGRTIYAKIGFSI